MSASPVELALGTVQLGMKYGIAGRGAAVPASEAKEILALAWRRGVRVFDTAPAYGDIEERLADLLGERDCTIVSKIPAFPQQLESAGVAAFVTDSIERSCSRLGSRLGAILFHSSADLMGLHGQTAWIAAEHALRGRAARLGASCYSPTAAIALMNQFPLQVVQLPGNALDQRLREHSLQGVELHLRSVFLQGLLLQPAALVAARLPKAAQAIQTWRRWCEEHGLTPLSAALSIAKMLPGVRYCVVGVDSAAQLEDILAAWTRAQPLEAPLLRCADGDVIDPRRWLQ